MPKKIFLESYGQSDIGRIRFRNEDYYAVKENIFIVADGIGGLNNGDVASRLAVETLLEYFKKREFDSKSNSSYNYFFNNIDAAIQEANIQILRYADKDNSGIKMGSTLVLALWGPRNTIHIANVGDARAYIYRKEKLQMLSQDHSIVGDMLRKRIITEEQARLHPQRHLVTCAVGVHPHVSPYYKRLSLEANDIILLCSDGLWDMVSNEKIRQIIKEKKEPKKISERLIVAANNANGIDNITVITIKALIK